MARQKGPFDAVQFTRESAERIASVVRTAEATPLAASPLTFEPYFESRMPKQVRQAQFSGSWPIGSSKVVTFPNAPTATASVTNLSWPIADTGYINENCIVGKEGTNWWLVVPVLDRRTAVFVTQTATALFVTQTASVRVIGSTSSQNVVTGVSTTGGTINYLSDVSVAASLNTADCSISVSVTKSSGSSSVITGVDATTGTITVIGSVNTAAAIAGSQTGIRIVTHFTSPFLRVRVP